MTAMSSKTMFMSTLLIVLLTGGACSPQQSNCVAVVPSTLLHQHQCEEAPQGLCFADYDNGL